LEWGVVLHCNKILSKKKQIHRSISFGGGQFNRGYFAGLKEYEKRKTRRKKVITYELEIGIDTKRNGKTYEKNEAFDRECTQLNLQWNVLFQTTYAGRHEYIHLNGNSVAYDGVHSNIIGWTEKREAFFKKFQIAFEDLIIEIMTFFEDEKSFLKKIEFGTLLLEKN
jgi:hypothetical protein